MRRRASAQRRREAVQAGRVRFVHWLELFDGPTALGTRADDRGNQLLEQNRQTALEPRLDQLQQAINKELAVDVDERFKRVLRNEAD